MGISPEQYCRVSMHQPFSYSLNRHPAVKQNCCLSVAQVAKLDFLNLASELIKLQLKISIQVPGCNGAPCLKDESQVVIRSNLQGIKFLILLRFMFLQDRDQLGRDIDDTLTFICLGRVYFYPFRFGH